MKQWQQWLAVAGILAVALALRTTGLDWDGFHHYHPDERYISWVATTIEWPANLQGVFDARRSSFNPFYWWPEADSDGIVVPQDEPRDFAYGHLPLYLGVAATRLVEWVGPALTPLLPDNWLLTQAVLNKSGLIEYKHVTAVARLLTALADTLTVLMTFLLGRRLFGPAAGLLAAAFLAISVLPIQLAHFFTVDPFLTFFVVTAVYLMVASSEGQGTTSAAPSASLDWLLVGAAIAIGLAVGSKFSAVLLFLPLALTLWLRDRVRWSAWLLGLGLVAFFAFFVTNPFAVLDWSCDTTTPEMALGPLTIPEINWGNCYLDNIATQRAMVSGQADLAFTRQYTGTRPFLYYGEMLLRWGLGWPLGVAALLGLVWVVVVVVRRLEIRDWRLSNWTERLTQSPITNLQLLITLAWVLPYTLSTGTFFVKFMRYVLPVLPFLLIFAAGMILALPGRWRWLLAGGVGVSTAVYTAAFMGLYQQPHPWVEASRWVFANVQPGTTILSEQWDDSLPSSMEIDGDYRRRSEYNEVVLRWHTRRSEADDLEKLNANLDKLADGEYLTILSNRLYGTAPRLPDKYPLSSQVHQLLFDGVLGYEVVAVYGRFPRLGPIHIKPDLFGWPGLTPPDAVNAYLNQFSGIDGGRVDESFVVYDQPLTIIFRNSGQLSADEMRAHFDLAPPAPSP